MNTNPCNVCGATELNLVDGYYYCVECGTQDVNVRETIVEQTLLADGSVAFTLSKKFNTIVRDGIEMSGEWYKWHAYNFILAGLTDELISLGAAPTVKAKVLWIWTRYIKEFQIKEDMSKTNPLENKTNMDDESSDTDIDEKNIKKEPKKFRRDIKLITKSILLTILYIALNLDRSDIQLYHLFTFIKEGRLSVNTCTKFIPAEIKTKQIPNWANFKSCNSIYTKKYVQEVAMTFFKRLDLGLPLVPNLTKIIDNCIKELCLPLDFRDFVLALTHLLPCDFMQLDEKSKKSLVRLPNYEVICMTYILLGLKICFGLDDDYEIRLSDAVDTINCNGNYLKSYKLGFHSEPSNRLFSFRDWYNYLHFRKTMLSKYHLYSAQTYGLPIDDYVLLEQVEKTTKTRVRFSDDVAMDILDKIHIENIPNVINKNEFPPSLTPLTTYVEVIGQFIQDPEIKLLLCEDFSQYSLKYAMRDLKLPSSDFKMSGVSKNHKTINNFVSGTLGSKDSDASLVYVRNCENQNWLKTNPPTVDHIIKDTGVVSPCDKENDHKTDSKDVLYVEKSEDHIYTPLNEETDGESDKIEEESIGVNIFDDEFIEDMEYYNDKNDKSKEETHDSGFDFNGTKAEDNSKFDVNENGYFSDDNNYNDYINPDEIDKNKIIQELIEIACKKYRIPLPKESTERKLKKRKILTPQENTGEILPKRRKCETKAKRGEVKNIVTDMISAYYKTLEDDLMNKISEQVRNVVNEIEHNSRISQNLINESIDGHDTSNGVCVISGAKSENGNESDIIEKDYILQDQNIADANSVIDGLIASDNDTENLIPKINPNYDANTHDINQLYVKLKEDLEYEDIFDINDTNLEKIIDRKIEEFDECKNVLKPHDNLKDVSNIIDSDDDIPLSVLRDEKIREENKKKHKNLKFEPLLTDRKNMKRFDYWLRHYKSRLFIKCIDKSERFNAELGNNIPKSFAFVIKECASIIDCSEFSLYKSLQTLEQMLITLKN